MVKLDANVLRYMTREEFRVLTAVEMGMKNHEIVPTELIERISALPKGGAFKAIKELHKNKLIYHDASKYDGFKLTYLGYDYLALKTFVSRGLITGIGPKIGVGKESDIYEVINEEGTSMVLKIHRLGRVSFRSIKRNRDYLQHRQNASWLYMSRLAAVREYAYMQALHDHEFPVPTPLGQNRHCILMQKVDGHPFGQVSELSKPQLIYNTLLNLIVRLAEHGLIHCDFNEFNLMISDENEITMIDFPQMISTSHPNAKEYFDRDVTCVRTYFAKRFKFESADFPNFFTDTEKIISLDTALKASGNDGQSSVEEGVTAEEHKAFEKMMHGRLQGDTVSGDDDGSGDEDENESEEEKTVPALVGLDAKTRDVVEAVLSKENESEDVEDGENEESDESDVDTRSTWQAQKLAKQQAKAERKANKPPKKPRKKERAVKGKHAASLRGGKNNLHRNRMKSKNKQEVQQQMKQSIW